MTVIIFSHNHPQSFWFNFHPNMLHLLHFHLSPALYEHVVAPGLTTPPLILCLDLCMHTPEESKGSGSKGSGNSCGTTSGNTEDPATSRKKGSFNWDQEKGRFSLKWANSAEFEKWHQMEEHVCCIEFIASSCWTGGVLWSQWQCVACRREESGGDRAYEKKNSERQHKIGTKKSGCSCHLIIKQYPHTPTILGCYVAEHDHEIGAANIAYTCLSGTVWEWIKSMLTQKIDCYEIVHCQNLNSLAANLIYLKVHMICDSAPDGSHNQLIALKEVNQIAHTLDNDEITLHSEDAISTRLYLVELPKETHIFYKDRQDCMPIDLIPEDAFVMCIQISFQLDTFRCLGGGFIGIDTTHNITQYQDLLLFTIIARDHWGYGKQFTI